MSGYQQYINDSLHSQHRQDRMREASTERALRAMRAEQRSERVRELTQPVSAVPRRSRLRNAWSSLLTNLASFL
jgi:hypothetical protein